MQGSQRREGAGLNGGGGIDRDHLTNHPQQAHPSPTHRPTYRPTYRPTDRPTSAT